MENSGTELSNRTAAFISWMEFLGMAMFVSSRLFFRQTAWIFYVSLGMIVCGYLYRLYADWKAGRKKAFWRRCIFFLIVVVVAAIAGYLAYKRDN